MISIISSNYKQRDKILDSPQEFAECCNLLALKTFPSVGDPELQKYHFQQAEIMLLSTFIAGLIEKAGQCVRFKLTQTLDKTLQIAHAIFEAEAQEKINETFYANSEKQC
jgi:hypothetical protein